MASRSAPSHLLPVPDPQQFASLLRNASDVVLLLDRDLTIVDIAQADGQGGTFPRFWLGRRLGDLLGPESQSKLPSLLAQDVTLAGTVARWRHLNLDDGAGGTVPLLLKYAGLSGQGNAGGMLLCRDLRPTVELQNRFRQSHRELESRIEALPVVVAPPTNGNGHAAHTARAGGAIVAEMIARLGHQPMDAIVRETSRVLERLCATEALDRTHGDRDQAARLLGITVEDLHLALMA